MLATVQGPSDAPPQQHDVPLLAVVPAPPGTSRLHFSWALGPRLLLTPLGGGGVSGGGRRQQAAEPPAGSVVQWSALSALERRLVYDTLPAVEELHAGLAQGADARPDWPDRVRAYAAEVSSQMTPPAVEGEEEDAVIAAARAEHAAWDWAALLFLGPAVPGAPLGEDVAAWHRAHASALCSAAAAGGDGGPPPLPLAACLARLVGAPAPEADAQYWPTAARAAALGWADEAVALLGAHSAWAEAGTERGGAPIPPGAAAALAALEPVALALRSQPRCAPAARVVGGADAAAAAASSSTAHTSPTEFAAARAAWLAGVRRCAADEGLWAAAAAGDAATAAGARALLRVLCAEPGAVDAAALGLLTTGSECAPPAAAATGSWPDVLVARCVHAGEGVAVPSSPGELAAAACAAASAAAACPAPPPLTPAAAARDAMLLGVAAAAAAGEPAGAAAALSAGCSAWCMAAATPVLYAHSPQRRCGEPLPHAGGSAGEWWALDLAAGLAGSAVTRPAAARLLAAACPVHGAGAAAALFSRSPGLAEAATAGDDGPALRAAASAARIGSAAGEAAVCRAAGVAHWRAGRPGAALTWLARAADAGRAGVAAGAVADSVRGGLGIGGGGRQQPGGGAEAASTLVADLAGPLAQLRAAGAAGGCAALAALRQLEEATAGPTPAPARLAAAALATAAAGPPSAVPAALFRAIPALEAPPRQGGAAPAVPAATVEAMVALLDGSTTAGGVASGVAREEEAAAMEGAVRLALARALARAYVAG